MYIYVYIYIHMEMTYIGLLQGSTPPLSLKHLTSKWNFKV